MTTFMLPALIAAYLLHHGYISAMSMPNEKERRLPFLLTAIIYYLVYYGSKSLPLIVTVTELILPSIIYLIILGATFSVLVALIINFRWKISVHMIGIGGLIGTLLGISLKYSADMMNVICIFIIAAGLIGFSRLKLKAHSLSQVYAGFFIGIFCELIFILSA
jgi:membrane-associated phospholipid phosphatase